MKPINPSKDLAHILENKLILLLNKRIFAHRYTQPLLSLASSKNTLPAEIWNAIFELVLNNSEDTFCWIQIVSKSATGKFLRCREVSFEFPRKPKDFKNRSQIDNFESFLNNSKHQRGSGIRRLYDEKKIEEKDKFSMLLPSFSEAFLFLDIQVVDAIKHMESGECHLCLSRRVIVPCPSRGADFTVFVSENVDEIVCPLCVGLQAAQYHARRLRELLEGNAEEDEIEGLEDWAHE
jgi:hypothetical protein